MNKHRHEQLKLKRQKLFRVFLKSVTFLEEILFIKSILYQENLYQFFAGVDGGTSGANPQFVINCPQAEILGCQNVCKSA